MPGPSRGVAPPFCHTTEVVLLTEGQSRAEPDETREDGDAPPGTFVIQVRDALSHLHDPAYLETHPLTRFLSREQGARKALLGRALRQALLEALESLHPGRQAGALARHSQLLQLRYVDGLGVREVYDRLAISRTEFYREQQQAVEAVASILWSRWGVGQAVAVTERGDQVGPAAGGEVPRPGEKPQARPNNLPLQLTSFIGREREIAEVKRLLGQARLLTLTGTGGCGKTRLAYQLAADLLTSSPEEYADGVWVVELAALADPSLVPQTVASALGLREETGRPILDTLVDHLRPRRILLVFDNCEHLLDASARLVDGLLHACPALRILATSREALGIAGETSYRVPSLSLPDRQHLPPLADLAGCESIHLFAERARAVQPSFELSERDAPAVAQICWRLDGMPLAIELAAARVRGLTVEGIARRLDDRFRLLTGGSRTALRRQQTLRAAIDWSYDLLSPAERCLFRRLAVFAGGWTSDAAESVCSGDRGEAAIEQADVLDLLLRLVDRSLVVAELAMGEERYRFPETIREYALEKLLESGEAVRVHNLHRDWALSLLVFDPSDASLNQGKLLLDRLEFEHENLRAMLSWCLETDPALGLRRAVGDSTAFGLNALWLYRGYPSEGRYWMRELLARAPEPTADRAGALVDYATLASDQGDLDEAKALAEEALVIARVAGDAHATVWSLVISGEVAKLQGDIERARTLLEEAADLARGLLDPVMATYPLNWLSEVAGLQGDYRLARECAEEAVAACRAAGNEYWAAVVSTWIAMVDQAHGDFARARQLMEEIVETFRHVGSRDCLGWSLSNLGYRVGCDGETDRGTSLLRESLVVLQSQGHRLRLGRCLYLLGIVEEDQAAHKRAVRLIGAGMNLVGKTHPEHSAAEVEDREASLAQSREALGDEAFARAWAEGQAMTLDQAVEYALADEGLSADSAAD